MTVADLLYDPETHTSKAPDGRDVPHVTHVLDAVGVGTDWSAVVTSKRMEQMLSFAGARGTAVHADCHAYDDGDLDWDAVDPVVRPYVEAWAAARENLGLVPVHRERRVFHERLFYTGTLDGIFERGTQRILVDIKSGEVGPAHLQTIAYQLAHLSEYPHERVDERWVVQLKPGLRVPYRTLNLTALPDAYLHERKWVACVTVYNEQPGRRAEF